MTISAGTSKAEIIGLQLYSLKRVKQLLLGWEMIRLTDEKKGKFGVVKEKVEVGA